LPQQVFQTTRIVFQDARNVTYHVGDGAGTFIHRHQANAASGSRLMDLQGSAQAQRMDP